MREISEYNLFNSILFNRLPHPQFSIKIIFHHEGTKWVKLVLDVRLPDIQLPNIQLLYIQLLRHSATFSRHSPTLTHSYSVIHYCTDAILSNLWSDFYWCYIVQFVIRFFAIMDVCYAEAAQTILGAFYELGLVRSLTQPNQT